jgi:hypothetical protein
MNSAPIIPNHPHGKLDKVPYADAALECSAQRAPEGIERENLAPHTLAPIKGTDWSDLAQKGKAAR